MDLDRLEAFVASLQPHTAVSEAVDRLHRLFHVLHTVASQYLESQTGAGRDDQQASTVDNCLAALGFPSQPAPGFQEAAYPAGSATDGSYAAFQRGVNPMIWMGNGAQLEDWFYNNEQMINILEDGFPEGDGWAAG